MSEGRKPDIWFAMYAEKFLWGTLKSELNVEERAVWIDFLCLAATFEGRIDITYPRKLAAMLVVPCELLQKAVKKFKKTKRIKIHRDRKDGKVYAIVTKWSLYQTEYLGGTRVRATQKPHIEKKAQRKGALQEKRREDITKEDKRGEENGLPPIPKNIDFAIQDQLKETRKSIREKTRLLTLNEEQLLKQHRITRPELEANIARLTAEYTTTIEDYTD